MRARCTICTDFFELQSVIVSAPCGHIFHDLCVTQWLKKSSTCPTCRKAATLRSLIRLYFDDGDEDLNLDSPEKLKNQIENLKIVIRQKDREKATMIKDKESIKEYVLQIEERSESLKQKHENCHSTISALKVQLKYLDLQKKEAQEAKEESQALKNSLKQLESLQILLQGSVNDADKLLNQYGNNSSDAKELAVICSLLKKELAMAVESKRNYKEELDKFKKDCFLKKQKIVHQSLEVKQLSEKVHQLEEIVKHLENEKESLTKKCECLQLALVSPSAPAASIINRFVCESPLPEKFKRPRLTNPEKDLDDSKLFLTPQTSQSSSQNSSNQKEEDLKVVKTTSSSRETLTKSNSMNIPSYISQMGHFLFSKATNSCSEKETIRKGYDGFGGHTKYVQRGTFLNNKQIGLVRHPTRKKNMIKPKKLITDLPNINDFI